MTDRSTDTRSFIEVQFPVSKLSKESYKERKAGDSQTLASLGKWHGRKPLVLVRALIFGLLLPATADPKGDRDVFLRLMTMDDEGMWRRCKGLSAREAAHQLTASERAEAIVERDNGQLAWNKELSPEKRKLFEKRAFLRMGYDERLTHCLRTEEIDGPDTAAWREFLHTGRMEVRVLPDSVFGLVHGKAGVVQREEGPACCFLGSANESKTAWSLNYEIVWLDDSSEGITWVQAEFDALWTHPAAHPLAEAVAADIERLSRRTTFVSVDAWKEQSRPEPASPIVELPVYRRENGLWTHQKYFVKLAFDAHRNGGARFVLADQVGLGKTAQLGLAAKLMALVGTRPVLVIAPKTLLEQWQEALACYRRRYGIETFFSDQKSRGFHLAHSHLSDPQRLCRLLIASCLAYLWMVCLGVHVQQKGHLSTIHRKTRCDLSLFQIGLVWLEHCLNAGLPLLAVFRLPRIRQLDYAPTTQFQ